MSPLSVLIVGVADCVTVTTRFLTRLFDSVSVVALPTIVSSESWKVYVLDAVFEFVKNDVNVLATFLKFILKRVSPTYPPVASFQEVSCLSLFRFEKFVFMTERESFTKSDQAMFVIVAIIP